MWSRAGIRYVAASLIIGAVIALNVLTYLVDILKPLTALLDPKTLTIVMGSIPSTLAGIAIASQLLAQGVADPQSVLLALIVGRALHTIAIEYPRYVLPLYASFYGLKLAAKLIAISIIITLTSLPIQIAIALIA